MSLDRIRGALERLARAALSSAPFAHVYEYRVIQMAVGGYLDLQPTDTSLGLPVLTRVLPRPGVAGSSSTPVPGSIVLVGFVNGSPARPYVAAWAAPGDPGAVPLVAALDGTSVRLGPGLASVVRVGDTVSITPGNGGGLVAGTIAVTVGLGVPPAPSTVLA